MIRDLCVYDKYLELENYNIVKFLAYEFFAKTFLGTDKLTGKEISISIFDFDKSLEGSIYFTHYVSILNMLDMPGVVQFLGYRQKLTTNDEKNEDKIKTFLAKNTDDKEQEYKCTGQIIFNEYLNNGCIYPLINNYFLMKGKECQKMNPTIRSKIIFGVAATMKKIHAKKIIHLNLQLESIFLDDNLEPKIGYFYNSKCVNETNTDELIFCKINNYLCKPPEMLFNKKYICDYSADVYSFGWMLYRMFNENQSKKLRLMKRMRSPRKFYFFYDSIKEGKRPTEREMISDAYWELIGKCWNQNPDERPSFEEITEILKDDRFAIEEFGMKTDLEELHEYQRRIDL